MRKIHPTIIFASVFLLIILFLSYQTQSPTPQSITLDPTANWKTYIDKSNTFSFKYPSDWSIPKEEKTQNIQQISFDNILVVTSRSASTLEEFVAKNLPTNKTQPVDYINGSIRGKKLIYKSGVDQTIVDVVIAFPGQTQNVITFSYTDFPGHILKSEIIDKILSTFKFF